MADIRVSVLTTVEEDQKSGKKTLLSPLVVYEFNEEQRQEFNHFWNDPEIIAIVGEAQQKIAQKLIAWGDERLAQKKKSPD